MKPIKYDIYTAYHTDAINKDVPGAAFAAVVVRETGIKDQVVIYGEEDTYMTAWMDGVADLLETIDRRLLGDETQDVIINIYMWHTNLQALCAKMSSIYRDLKDFRQDVSKLVDRKLLKTNRTKYDTHDSQVTIVNSLLSINKKVKLIVKMKPLPPKEANMGTAYQLAELAVEEQKT